MTQPSWSRDRMESHVKQRLRERVDVALHWGPDGDDNLIAYLREGGEDSVWQVILESLAEAGWELRPGGKIEEESLK